MYFFVPDSMVSMVLVPCTLHMVEKGERERLRKKE
jgi:hypothetical protein